MRRFTIELRTREEADADRACRLDLVDEDGRRCDGLCLGELLEQVTSLCHQKLGEPADPRKTPDQWHAEREARCQRLHLQLNTQETP